MLQVKTHRHGIDLFQLVDDLVQAHVFVVRKGLADGGVMERMFRIGHPVVRKQDVVRVQVPGRLEFRAAMELHARTQLEGVGQAIGRHFPRLGQAGHDVGGAELELDQPVVHRHAGGVGRGTGGEELGIESFGTAFGTEDQCFCGRGHAGAGAEDGDEGCLSNQLAVVRHLFLLKDCNFRAVHPGPGVRSKHRPVSRRLPH